jgi:hypothetical protein
MDKSIPLCHIPVSQAYIHGSPEMYIRSGSDISLSCVAKDMPEPPTHFTWYKGLQIFSTGGNDGHQLFQGHGQQQQQQQQQQHQNNNKQQTSFFGKSSIMTSLSGRKVTIETSQQGLENLLLIRNAVAGDSGNYTCIPAGAEPASIVVHVLNGMSTISFIHSL